MHLLRNQSVLLLVIIALLTSGTKAYTQQDEGPILRPKKQLLKPASVTLLVKCDLACNWELDGKTMGHIAPGDSAKAKVIVGPHFVSGFSEDGWDQVEQLEDVKKKGQTVVAIELKPVRDARLKAEQQEKAKVEQEARDKTAREQQEKDRQEREVQEKERLARERAAKEEAERQPWTDPTTGLMWTKRGSGDVSWPQAVYYCRNLRLGGHDDWRLPTIDELSGILDAYMKADLFPIGANLKDIELPGLDTTLDAAWSSSQVLGKKGRAAGNVWALTPYTRVGGYINNLHTNSFDPEITWCCRAWCVWRASKP